MTTTALCTQNDIEYIWSDAGVLARLDDNEDGVGDAGNITAMLTKATTQVQMYLCRRYTSAQLATSDWVKWCTATIAAYYLGARRGNPVPEFINEDAKRYWEDLAAIRDGKLDIPELADGAESIPTVSNFTVDGRYRRGAVRRIPEISTGKRPGGGVKKHETRDYQEFQ